MKKSIFAFLLLTAAAAATARDYSQEIREVKEGKRTEAQASWWGFDETNATQCLQKAINSKVPRLIIDNTGKDWILDRIRLVSNQEIVLDRDVRLVARKGGFKTVRGASSFISFGGGENITLRGEPGAIIMMHKKDYQDKNFYEPSEWRHMLDIRGGKNITIRDLRLESSGGDGIYLGNGGSPDQPAKHCTNIIIENVVAHNHHRQGISVITAENLLIKNCVFSNTGGTAPQAGIDFEPNSPDEKLVNCRVEDCTFINNKGPGTDNYLVNLTENSEPVSITYLRCKIKNNARGAKISAAKATLDSASAAKGKIEYIDCDISGSYPVDIADSWQGFQVVLKNCRITARKHPGITITAVNAPYPVGNVILDHVEISGGTEAPVFFKYSNGKCFETPLSGNLKFNGKAHDYSGYMQAETAHSQELAKLKPASNIDGMKAAAGNNDLAKNRIHWFRRGAVMLLQAQAGEKIQVRMHPHQQPPANGKVTVFFYKPGTKKPERTVVAVNPEGFFTYDFTADQDGVYRVGAESGAERYHLHFESDHAGQGMFMKQSFQLFKPQGKIYFQVPPGTGEFKIVAWCNPGHHADISLIDAAGNKRRQETRITRAVVLEGKPAGAKPEIWSIECGNASEILYIMLTEPLAPVVSDNPALMLVK